jgi:pimeloyl-ACP methyl ester carboxylesterase
MRAVRAGGPLELVERDVPEPAHGEVRVRIEACGVCNSDSFTVEGQFPGIWYDGGYAEARWLPPTRSPRSPTSSAPPMLRRCSAPGSPPSMRSATAGRCRATWSRSSASAALAISACERTSDDRDNAARPRGGGLCADDAWRRAFPHGADDGLAPRQLATSQLYMAVRTFSKQRGPREKILAGAPAISIPTIRLEGDTRGAPRPDPNAYARKFSGRYQHRTIGGGVGHNFPQEEPQAFAQAIVAVKRM